MVAAANIRTGVRACNRGGNETGCSPVEVVSAPHAAPHPARGSRTALTMPRSHPGVSRAPLLTPLLAALALLAPVSAHAQDNYEIQVYGADLVPAGATMVELHSNYTAQGRTQRVEGLLATNHAEHETLEITHGFNEWLEVGFYLFTSARSGQGWQWVGDHIRPRIAIPASWHWPIGLSLSQEFGYQRRAFSLDTWTWEIRPIIDQRLGRWYWALNPAFERSLHGEGVRNGFEFAPNAQVTYDISPTVTGALEYYGSWGPVWGLDPWSATEEQLFPSVDLKLGSTWEFNAGVGFGLTARATDRLLLKMILGYRLGGQSR